MTWRSWCPCLVLVVWWSTIWGHSKAKQQDPVIHQMVSIIILILLVSVVSAPRFVAINLLFCSGLSMTQDVPLPGDSVPCSSLDSVIQNSPPSSPRCDVSPPAGSRSSICTPAPNVSCSNTDNYVSRYCRMLGLVYLLCSLPVVCRSILHLCDVVCLLNNCPLKHSLRAYKLLKQQEAKRNSKKIILCFQPS